MRPTKCIPRFGQLELESINYLQEAEKGLSWQFSTLFSTTLEKRKIKSLLKSLLSRHKAWVTAADAEVNVYHMNFDLY